MSSILDCALEHARHGFAVLPLRENGKEPATINGYYDASTIEAEIAKWFAKPTVNIGIRVGQESNIIVIDPDNKGGKDGRARLAELEARLGQLPLTRTIETRYGKHYYFKFPAKWSDALIKSEYAPGLDIKAKGYVVAPPSTVDGFTYFVKNDIPIAELPNAWVKDAINTAPNRDDWKRLERPRGSGVSICEEYDIHLNDVLEVPTNARKTSDGYLIKHPIHGATGSGNLSLNMARDLWHCFRCGSGGDPLTWVAVREHFIDCADAGPLDRDTIKRCLEVLRKEGKVPDEATVRAAVTVSNNGKEETYSVKLRPLNDVANVERFLSRHGDDIRWCEETRRWVAFNGARWEEVSSDYVKRCARDVSAIIRHESALITELNKSDDEKKQMTDKFDVWARLSSFKNRIDAIIELSKGDLAISVHAFNRDPLLFNCENGTFNIASDEMQPHNRDDYITHYYAVPYEPGSKNRKWESFLARVQPSSGIREFLKRAAGYSLTGLTNEEALFFCYGGGSTGKSTFLDTLRSAAASYGDVSKFATFLADRNASGGSPREDITRLMGLRMTICNEVNRNTRFNGALLKTLVSGELYVARVPYSPQSVSFEPTFKLWLAANDRPKIDYDDDAAFRRFYIVPFNVVIAKLEQDKGLRNYFKQDSDAQKAVLAWALEGAVEWYKLSNGGHSDGLLAPAEIVSETKAYQLAMNPVHEFIMNECAIGCDANGLPFEVEGSSLWDVYSDARSHYDMRTVKSSVSLGKYLSKFGFESFQETTGSRERKWRYIRLLDPETMPEQPALVKCRRTDERIKGSIIENSYHEGDIGKVCDFCALIRSCVREPVVERLKQADQAALATHIYELLGAAKGVSLALDSDEQLAEATAIKIKQQHPEFSDYPVEQFCKKLVESDKQLQGLVAGLTGGKVRGGQAQT